MKLNIEQTMRLVSLPLSCDVRFWGGCWSQLRNLETSRTFCSNGSALLNQRKKSSDECHTERTTPPANISAEHGKINHTNAIQRKSK